MTYDFTIERNQQRGRSTAGQIGLIAALAGAVALISLSGIQPSTPQQDSAVSVEEDWHGNVRRSNWPN